MLKIKKIGILDFKKQFAINNILYECGKDMAKKYDIHHWDNSHFKNFIIIEYCLLKNTVFVAYDGDFIVATIQARKSSNKYILEKLAVLPSCSGRGIGTACLEEMEKKAKKENCDILHLEVYEKSERAIKLYTKLGFKCVGETNTLKYKEVVMEKQI